MSRVGPRLSSVVLILWSLSACGGRAAGAPGGKVPTPDHTSSAAPVATPTVTATPTPSPEPWRSVTSDDGLLTLQYPPDWSEQNCTSPPWVRNSTSVTQAASFLFFPDGKGNVQTCDYAKVGDVTVPTTDAPPWIAVSEVVQPADTPLWSTCGEGLTSQSAVKSENGTDGTKYSYQPSSGNTCGVSESAPYSGPPLGYLTVYSFPLRGSAKFAYCIVQDWETPSSPDERQHTQTLVEQTLRIR